MHVPDPGMTVTGCCVVYKMGGSETEIFSLCLLVFLPQLYGRP